MIRSGRPRSNIFGRDRDQPLRDDPMGMNHIDTLATDRANQVEEGEREEERDFGEEPTIIADVGQDCPVTQCGEAVAEATNSHPVASLATRRTADVRRGHDQLEIGMLRQMARQLINEGRRHVPRHERRKGRGGNE